MKKEDPVREFLDNVYGYTALREFLAQPRSLNLYNALEGTILGTTPGVHGSYGKNTITRFRPPMIKETADVDYYGSVLQTQFPYHIIHHSTFVQTPAKTVRTYLMDHIHAFFPDTITAAFGTRNRRWHYTFSNPSLWCYLSGSCTESAKSLFLSFDLPPARREELDSIVCNYIAYRQKTYSTRKFQ